jgi:ElaB/YqjD/DUF883 family membrane-anchored ribosome-binding protein
MSNPSYGGSTDMSERAAGLTDAASRQFDRALDGAEHAARSAAEQGRQAMSAIDQTVRQQPLASLAAVGVLGIVIGALWKMDSGRRSSSRWY